MYTLLLKFGPKEDRNFGVSEKTLKALARKLQLSETTVVHIAIERLAIEVLPRYEQDDGPLTTADLARLCDLAKPMLPKGKLINKRSLFEDPIRRPKRKSRHEPIIAHVTPVGGNIFLDLGFSEEEAAKLKAEVDREVDAELAARQAEKDGNSPADQKPDGDDA